MSNVIDLKKRKLEKSSQERYDASDRLTRIRESLDRINKLMEELRKMSQNTDSMDRRK